MKKTNGSFGQPTSKCLDRLKVFAPPESRTKSGEKGAKLEPGNLNFRKPHSSNFFNHGASLLSRPPPPATLSPPHRPMQSMYLFFIHCASSNLAAIMSSPAVVGPPEI
jgi:hypothetical protein